MVIFDGMCLLQYGRHLPLCIDRNGPKSLPAHLLLLRIWSLLFELPPPAFLGVGLLYKPFLFPDPLFLLAPLRFPRLYVGILLALPSNAALIVVDYCRTVLYTHVVWNRQFVPLSPHCLLTSVVRKSTRVFRTQICADF